MILIVRLLEAHGALRKEIVEDSNALLNTCGYSEEEIRHPIEKREEEKEAIYLPKVQEGKEETILTREEHEAKEEIIYIRE
jgi:hypothetical protein